MSRRGRRLFGTATVSFLFCVIFLGLPVSASGRPDQSSQPASAAQQDAARPAAPAVQRVPATRKEREEFADLLMARKQYAEAAAAYRKLVTEYPKDAVLLNKIGIAYHQQLEWNEAKRFYERAIKADPKYANAYNNLGTIYYQKKKYNKAIKQYTKAIAIRTDFASVHSNLGYAYFALKRYDDALVSFRRALELDNSAFEHSDRAATLLQDRSVEDRGRFYFYLAKSYATMGDPGRCAQYLRKARDEGYKDWLSAKTDPAFAPVLSDPSVQEVLQQIPAPGETKAPGSPPNPPGA